MNNVARAEARYRRQAGHLQRMAAAIRADRAAGEWTWDESIGLGRAAVRLEGAAADLEIVAGLLAERNSRKETL